MTDDGATKRSRPLNYLDREFVHVNVAEYDGEEVQIVITTGRIEEDILATARVVDDHLLWVLADEALTARTTIREFGLHSITIGELTNPDEATTRLQEQLESAVRETR